jgi:AAA15 family ATPase/GTPase
MEVSFVVNDKTTDNNNYFTAPSGFRLSKVETVIGPNASGKTNLLKILPFLKWLIADSFILPPNAMIPIKPFLLGEGNNESSELIVNFEMDGEVYRYAFVLNEKRILNEELSVKNKSKQRSTRKKIFSRIWNETNNSYDFIDKELGLLKDVEKMFRENASVISTAIRVNNKKSQQIFQYWQKIKTNVVESGRMGDFLTPNPSLFFALDFYSDNENEKYKVAAEKFLSVFDVGITSFDVKKDRKNDNNISFSVGVGHLINGKTEYLPLQYESSGTKQLFVLLSNILPVLDKGGTTILDEIDVNLHPDIVLFLFKLFTQPDTNPHNAQLLFSTHNILVLSHLEKYQIILTEKNEEQGTDAWRLDEMDGVRVDDNYFAKYIAGAYGAFPRIDY